MDRERMIDVLKMDRDLALFDPTIGECRPTNELNAESAEALDMAIKELEGKDINVPTNSALDHIHNVVAEREYQRGYEQGKADAAPEWIPFTAESAPKEDGLYIVKHKTKTGGKAISADSYSTAYGEWFINHNDAVIAWMPAPKEEGEQSGKVD